MVTRRCLASFRGSGGLILVRLTKAPKLLDILDIVVLSACEDARLSNALHVDPEVLFVGASTRPAEELSKAIAISDKVMISDSFCLVHGLQSGEERVEWGTLGAHPRRVLVDVGHAAILRDPRRVAVVPNRRRP